MKDYNKIFGKDVKTLQPYGVASCASRVYTKFIKNENIQKIILNGLDIQMYICMNSGWKEQ